MQRRAAAVYFALFVVLGAGAYTYMQVGMSQPAVEIEGPTYAEGDEFTAGGQAYTVGALEGGSGELLWYNETADEEQPVEIEDGGNVTLGDTQHFAHFPTNTSVQVLPTDEHWQAYQSELDAQSYYQERQNGFWGIVLLSFVGAILLLAAAYLPTKG